MKIATEGMSIAERLDYYSVPEPNSGCVLWIGYVEHGGYGRMQIKQIKYLAHRVAYELAFGPIPEGMCALHRCDTPACINPKHLFLGTYADNNHDRDAKGRHKPMRGARNGGAKLDANKVVEIRSLHSAGFAQREIARRFGVSHRAVGRIVHGTHWRCVA